MAGQVDLIVRGGTVVTPRGRGAWDLAADGGRFVAIARRGGLPARGREEIDATGLLVLPGVIDGHVHFRDPGFPHKEDGGSGTRAAVMGGVTTVLDMPNTLPVTDTAERARAKLAAIEPKAWCDLGLIGLVTTDNLAQLRPMAEHGLVVGVKAFLGQTVGAIAAPTDGAIVDAMREVASLGLRFGFHAENHDLVEHGIARMKALGRTDPLAHPDSRPALAEVESIGRMALFAQATGCPIHIFHLTSRQGLDMVERWRRDGVDITCETGPQYCFLGSEDMATLGARMRINPPVRARAEGHGEALLDGLARGRIDAIATDHSPHTHAEKLHDDIWQAVSGFAGVETSLRLFLTHGVGTGRLSLERLVHTTSEGPARAWGLYPTKGAIRVGSDADLTVVDLERDDVIEEARLHGRSNLTPFEGWRTRGAAVATVVRGRVVMRDGELQGEPAGRRVVRAAPDAR